MYVVHNDTDWPVLVASVAGVEVGKLVPPHSTWQVRPPDERRQTATNEPVRLQFKIRGQNWRRDDMGACRSTSSAGSWVRSRSAQPSTGTPTTPGLCRPPNPRGVRRPGC